MSATRSRWWLLLEWAGATLLRAAPDVQPVNAALARLYYFFYNRRRFPNLRTPRHFNEKLIRLKLSAEARDPLRRRLTDKEHVKAHVEARFGPGHVAPTLAVLRAPEEVDAFAFPLPCVVKPTHSSQEVMFLDDVQPGRAERARLKYWLRKDYFAANREPNYKGLEKKLIVEPVLGGAFGRIEDVKVLCFHGRPKLIQVDYGRYAEHRRDYFDIAGAPLPIRMRVPPAGSPFPYPDMMSRILEMAERLSAGFTFIRVDFYVVDGAALVGELTSFPTNCTVPFEPLSADLILARLFDEPNLEITPTLFGVSPDSSADAHAPAQPAAA
ncbi:ATP-grasp fold amidoligase family protein [Amphiplicatus metriothermophilus]|uniref:TupA-like ATPgrasp n=1 Tax=Amphiplicatus metriothermophilus TaxID=1519374 RepID=A0A239PK01_9PROT|nr:ATP-grasp fold amidoligase family protein [Amphiplicatus metriothermophilus]MBB5517699.1 hypothetical protein [Amphiplicatus metriothermophilus]SNT67967.1 TupA-like ATPgrasp [Amphiplicatus metriothermophilus]